MKPLELLEALTLTHSDPLKKADAIICLEGDGYERLAHTALLYRQNWSAKIVLSGNENLPPFKLPSSLLKLKLLKLNIPEKNIILENDSKNTREQALAVALMAKNRKWKKIILVGSPFHQLRAYLTFLKAFQKAKLKTQIINAPANNLSWLSKTSLGKSRLELFKEEIIKINAYEKKGHLANLATLKKHQLIKEKKS